MSLVPLPFGLIVSLLAFLVRQVALAGSHRLLLAPGRRPLDANDWRSLDACPAVRSVACAEEV